MIFFLFFVNSPQQGFEGDSIKKKTERDSGEERIRERDSEEKRKKGRFRGIKR